MHRLPRAARPRGALRERHAPGDNLSAHKWPRNALDHISTFCGAGTAQNSCLVACAVRTAGAASQRRCGARDLNFDAEHNEWRAPFQLPCLDGVIAEQDANELGGGCGGIADAVALVGAEEIVDVPQRRQEDDAPQHRREECACRARRSRALRRAAMRTNAKCRAPSRAQLSTELVAPKNAALCLAAYALPRYRNTT